MDTRSYKKYTSVFSELKSLIAELRQQGETALPVERKLSDILQSSRMTLRKALDEARELGLIRQDKGKNIILNHPSARPAVVFLANGRHSAFKLPALERLWLNLKPKLAEINIDAKLIMSEPSQTTSSLLVDIAAADAVLAASFSVSDPEIMTRELLHMQKHKPVIGVLECFDSVFDRTITLDNHSVGVIAASELIAAGCRHVLGFCYESKNNDISFRLREQGFVDTLAGHDTKVQTHWLDSPIPDYPESARNFINMKAEEGIDGVFIFSDEGINTITGDLFSRGLVPETINLVTLNGSGAALRHDPPISCISHATDGVINAIVSQLSMPFSLIPATLKIRVKPRLYTNNTLRHRQNNNGEPL